MNKLTVEACLYIVEFCDLGSRDGKSEIFELLKQLPKEDRYRAYKDGRDAYKLSGMSLDHANMMMVLDVASNLPGSEEFMDKIDSLRPDCDTNSDGDRWPLVKVADDAIEMEIEEKKEVQAVRRRTDEELETAVCEITKAKTLNMAKSVVWVTSHLQTRPELIDLDEVPSMWAWTTYNWARGDNETEYRRLYDSKLIPTGGLGIAKDLGFVDDGKQIDAILIRMTDPETGIGANGDTTKPATAGRKEIINERKM